MKINNQKLHHCKHFKQTDSKLDSTNRLNFAAGFQLNFNPSLYFNRVSDSRRVKSKEDYQKEIDKISRRYELDIIRSTKPSIASRKSVIEVADKLKETGISCSIDNRFPESPSRLLKAVQDFKNNGLPLPKAVYSHPRPFLQAQLEGNSSYLSDAIKYFNMGALGMTDPKLGIVYVDPRPDVAERINEQIKSGRITSPPEWHELAHIAHVKTAGLDKFEQILDRNHQTSEEIQAARNISRYAAETTDQKGKNIANNGVELIAEYLGGKVYAGLKYGENADRYYEVLGGPKVNKVLDR